MYSVILYVGTGESYFKICEGRLKIWLFLTIRESSVIFVTDLTINNCSIWEYCLMTCCIGLCIPIGYCSSCHTSDTENLKNSAPNKRALQIFGE